MLNVLDFSYADDLLNRLEVLLIIKGFHQLAIVAKIIARKGNRSLGLTVADDASMRMYSLGVIAQLTLPLTSFEEQDLSSAIWRVDCAEPFDADVCNAKLAFSTGSEVRLVSPTQEVQTIRSDWMSFVHTLEFSEDCKRILIVSAGFDTIIKCEVETGEVLWEWNAWDHGFNQSAMEMKFVTRLAEQAALFAERYGQGDVLYVTNPNQWPPEGIPTPMSPVRLNGASYGEADTILATCYHRPELFIIDRDGSFRTINHELKHPHSFRRILLGGKERYCVTDSGRGRILILDDDFNITELLDFTTLDAEEKKRKEFGEWIQTASLINIAGNDVFISVDALRSGLHILDFTNRRRRFISYPLKWTVQTVIPLTFDWPSA
jgi:hypothetical protein